MNMKPGQSPVIGPIAPSAANIPQSFGGGEQICVLLRVTSRRCCIGENRRFPRVTRAIRGRRSPRGARTRLTGATTDANRHNGRRSRFPRLREHRRPPPRIPSRHARRERRRSRSDAAIRALARRGDARRAARAHRDDAGHRRCRRTAVRAHRPAEGRSTPAASSSSPTTRAARAASSPRVRTRRCCSTGSSWSGRSGSKGASASVGDGESDAYFASRPLGRAWRVGIAAKRGHPRPRLAGGAFDAAQSTLRRCGAAASRRTGAATAWCRTCSNSGRVARRGCTIASAIARDEAGTGASSASHRERRCGAPPKFLSALIGLGICNHAVLARQARDRVAVRAVTGASALVVGTLMGLYAFLPMLLAVLAGRLSDRMGVRKPMLVGSCGIMLGAAIPILLPGIAPLFVATSLIGVSFMVFQIVDAERDRLVRAARRSRAQFQPARARLFDLAVRRSADRRACSIDHASFKATFARAGAAAAAADRRALHATRSRCPGRHRAHARNAGRAARAPRTIRSCGASSSSTDCCRWHGICIRFSSRSTARGIGLSASRIGVILASFAAATFVVRLLMPRIVRRFTELQVLTCALFIAGCALRPVSASSTQLGVLMALSFTLGLALGSGQPMVMSLLHSIAPAGRMGEAAGVRMTHHQRIDLRHAAAVRRGRLDAGTRPGVLDRGRGAGRRRRARAPRVSVERAEALALRAGRETACETSRPWARPRPGSTAGDRCARNTPGGSSRRDRTLPHPRSR